MRSFGTEERETNYPVPPQNQVYDYILFRGSDIKDIRVVNNVTSMPNDPAIMQLSVPNPLSNKPFQAQGFPHPGMGQMGQFAGGYSAMEALAPGMRGPMGNNKPSELNMPGPVPPPHLSPAVMEPPRPNENGKAITIFISLSLENVCVALDVALVAGCLYIVSKLRTA